MTRNLLKLIIIWLILINNNTFSQQELNFIKENLNFIAPGIKYYKIKMSNPIKTEFHILECDLKEPSTSIEPAICGEFINGSLEKVDSIVKRNNAIAGINANYFGYQFNSSPVGEIEGISVINGELVSTISTVNSWLNAGVGVTRDRKVIMGRPVKYEISICAQNREKYKKVLVNSLKWEGYDYVIIYTPKIGSILQTTESPYFILSPIRDKKLTVGQQNLFEVLEIKKELPNISENVCVLTGIGEGKEFLLNNLKKGDKVSITIEFKDIFKNVWQMIGGKIRMVLNGKNRLEKGHPKDSYEERMSAGRMGEKTLILCCGTSTCYVMAELLVELGVLDAIMLDGGGSATMVVRDETVYGGSREVADALLIFSEPNQGKL